MRIALTLLVVLAPLGVAYAESVPATQIVPVSTSSELTAAIAAAQPGDVITLASGTYALGNVNCAANGYDGQPIVVRAAESLGAKLELDGTEGFRVTGMHWQFIGLDVRGTCATDDACEHAFHVMGAADGFVLRESRVRDFNAQLKVNAAMVSGTWTTPNRGLVEYNEIGDTRGRNTANPVTKLNIDTGEDWIVRGNYLHDAVKLGGNGISYLAFMKSGGKRGRMERNRVLCANEVATGGTARIGLSLGGGGTAPQFCAPAFDINTPCSVEHEGGVIRNNIIANCSDVGVYLNLAKDSKVLYNTLVATTGIDFRFQGTTGEAVGNVLTGTVKPRDGGTVAASANLENVAPGTFSAMYQEPLVGNLAITGDISALVGIGPARTDVTNDYCARMRPTGSYTLGALEHSLGSCDTLVPPIDPGGDGGGGGADGARDGITDGATGNGGGCCGVGGDPVSSGVLVAVIGCCVRRRRVHKRA